MHNLLDVVQQCTRKRLSGAHGCARCPLRLMRCEFQIQAQRNEVMAE
jgi:hypothetical protein